MLKALQKDHQPSMAKYTVSTNERSVYVLSDQSQAYKWILHQSLSSISLKMNVGYYRIVISIQRKLLEYTYMGF